MLKSDPRTPFVLVFALALVWLFAALWGVDRRTSIDVGESLSVVVMVVFPVIMSLWLLHGWLRPPESRWMSDRIESLWRQSPSGYRALGLFYAALTGAASWGVAFLWLSTISQYLPGSDELNSATVIGEERVVGGRGACRHKMNVRWEGGTDTASLCVLSRGDPVPFPPVVTGDRVEVTVRSTMLGRHVRRIDAISHRPLPSQG